VAGQVDGLNPGQGASPTTLMKGAYALVLFLLILQFIDLSRFSWWAIRYPFELDYGEGVVWQQMRLIISGRAFGEFSDFPAIANNYPPVFHMLTYSIASVTGCDPLAAGRALSLGALLATAWVAGAIVYRLAAMESAQTAARTGALVGALLLFCIAPISYWTPVMRVDMLALVLSLGGMYLSFRSFERPGFIYLASVAFVLALYTKQIMLAAPAASFAVLYLVSPRTALKGTATCLALGGLILAALCWATDGGFARHLFGANINRFDPKLLLIVPLQVMIHLVLIGLACLAAKDRLASLFRQVKGNSFGEFRRQLSSSPASAMSLALLIYLALATLMLGSIAKSGSNLNYMIEWFVIVAILVGLRVADVSASVRKGEQQPVYAVFLLVALGIQIAVIPQYRVESQTEAELGQLSDLVRSAEKPVISDDMVLLLRSGKEVMVEPGYVAELSGVGFYDNSKYIRKIRNGEFAFFVTHGERGDRMFDSRHSPDVAGAMYAAYPRKHQIGGLTLHLPRHPQ
jgi:hypothetical protein